MNAWEILEALTKVPFLVQEGKDDDHEAVEALVALGEVETSAWEYDETMGHERRRVYKKP